MEHRLLLADDSITIQKVVELILSDEGFVIKTASNGEEAWLVIPEFKPDLVLADIEMPVMNGYTLCEKIKADPLYKAIPVILMAGAFEPLDENTLTRAGAEAYIIKPFESLELIDKIKSILAARESVKPESEKNAIGGEGFEAEVLSSEADRIEDQTVPLIDSIEETSPEITIPEENITEETAETFTATNSLQRPLDFPSRDEITDIIKNTLHNEMSSLLLISDIRDSMDRILGETVPQLAEKYLEEILRTNMALLTKQLEKIIWETVPRIAETIISKEIEKIKSEL